MTETSETTPTVCQPIARSFGRDWQQLFVNQRYSPLPAVPAPAAYIVTNLPNSRLPASQPTLLFYSGSLPQPPMASRDTLLVSLPEPLESANHQDKKNHFSDLMSVEALSSLSPSRVTLVMARLSQLGIPIIWNTCNIRMARAQRMCVSTAIAQPMFNRKSVGRVSSAASGKHGSGWVYSP